MNIVQRFSFVLAVLTALTLAPVAYGTTWHVSTEGSPTGDGTSWATAFDTIQAGIDASTNGDTVLLADGTYTGQGNFNLDYNGRIITVRSHSGNPHECIINCEFKGRGFHFHSNEPGSSIVDGLTIMNGDFLATPDEYRGTGILCDSSSPTINNCVLVNNKGHVSMHYGGAIYFINSQASISNCIVLRNEAYQGAGVYIYNSAVSITNSAIIGNKTFSPNGSSEGTGGGIYCRSSSLTLTNCSLLDNMAGNSAGGIYSSSSEIVMTNCIVWGTGLQVYSPYSSTLAATWSNIKGGTGNSWFGAGCIDADPLLYYSDSIQFFPESPCIDAGTNDPAVGLPGFDLYGTPRPIDGNGDNTLVADMGAYEFSPDHSEITFTPSFLSIISKQGESSIPDQTMAIRNTGGEAMVWTISGQPDWMTVSPTSGTLGENEEEVTLHFSTTELQAGTYTAVLRIESDQALHSPDYMTISLMVRSPIRVPQDYPTIQEAVDISIPGDIVEIADGTYSGTGNTDIFVSGRGITIRSASGNPDRCIIDCLQQSRGITFYQNEQNNSILEGITIKNGQAPDVQGDIPGGGGIYCYRSSPTIRNCVICDNTLESDGLGAGIYNKVSNPHIIDCRICGNYIVSPRTMGAGIANFCSNPVITNCLFSNNHAEDSEELGSAEGGAIWNNYSRPIITNCTFHNNYADVGDGIANTNSSYPVFTNCIFSNDHISETSNSLVTITYSNIQDYENGEGNMYEDPEFIDSNGPDDDITTWQDNDYRLSPTSACIDTGTNNPSEGLPAMDILGNPRPIDGNDDGISTADMGAYEYQALLPGDLDDDDDVDLDDFALFADCLAGPNVTIPPDGIPLNQFNAADLDHDGDVDLQDFAIFQEQIEIE